MAGGPMDALAEEVGAQPAALAAFAGSMVRRAPKGSIFVGAGDSYAAALAGFYASRGRCIALDPYSLASGPEIAEGLEVYFISVSGRTSSNLAAAKRVGNLAKRTTAITAVVDSPLGKLTDRVFTLPVRHVPKTPGILSFTLSLLAVLKLSTEVGRPDFRRALEDGKKDRELLSFGAGETYLLGNSLGYVAALYTAAKTYEFLGAKAHPELLEEFSHMEMFSLSEGDQVNIFACFDPSAMASKLARALRDAGYSSRLVPSRGGSEVDRLFHAVFVGQLSVIDASAKAGLREPRFLSAGGRLRASDRMIY